MTRVSTHKMNMDDLRSKLNLDTMISTIQDDVKKYVTAYMEEKFSHIATEIAKQCGQNEDTVMQWIRSAVNMKPPVVTKRKANTSSVDTVPCSAKTKAGTACKYKCEANEKFCKKHIKLHATQASTSQAPVLTSNLPNDEQNWLNDQDTYKTSYFPVYENSDLTMDDDIVDDTNVVTHE
jgi:hypothetical protein